MCIYTHIRTFTLTLFHIFFTTKGVSCLTGSNPDNADTHTCTYIYIYVCSSCRETACVCDHRCNKAPSWLRLNSSVCLFPSVSLPSLPFPFNCSYTEKSIIENDEHYRPSAVRHSKSMKWFIILLIKQVHSFLCYHTLNSLPLSGWDVGWLGFDGEQVTRNKKPD